MGWDGSWPRWCRTNASLFEQSCATTSCRGRPSRPPRPACLPARHTRCASREQMGGEGATPSSAHTHTDIVPTDPRVVGRPRFVHPLKGMRVETMAEGMPTYKVKYYARNLAARTTWREGAYGCIEHSATCRRHKAQGPRHRPASPPHGPDGRACVPAAALRARPAPLGVARMSGRGRGAHDGVVTLWAAC
jgi:hypothetical protein